MHACAERGQFIVAIVFVNESYVVASTLSLDDVSVSGDPGTSGPATEMVACHVRAREHRGVATELRTHAVRSDSDVSPRRCCHVPAAASSEHRGGHNQAVVQPRAGSALASTPSHHRPAGSAPRDATIRRIRAASQHPRHQYATGAGGSTPQALQVATTQVGAPTRRNGAA